MTLIQRSIAGGVMVLVLLLLRKLASERLPKWTFVLLGDVILLRLLFSLSLPSGFSIYNLLRQSKTLSETAPQLVVNAIPVEQTPIPQFSILHGGGAEGLTQKPLFSVEELLPVLWLVGAVLMGAAFLVLYYRCYRRFSISLPATDEDILHWQAEHPLRRGYRIRISQEVASPLTYGILSPVILLPKEMDKTHLSLVLTHEWSHIRRWDTLRKAVLALTLTLHWFNPLVWLLYWQMNRDMELACDEAVLRHTVGDSRKRYALALLELEERQIGVLPLYNGFSRSSIEERVRAIMKNRKPTVIISALAVILVLCVAVCFGTMGKNREDATHALSHGEELRNAAMHFVTVIYTTDYEGRFSALQEARDNTAADMEAAVAEYMSGIAELTTPDCLEQLTLNRIPYKYDGLNSEEHPWTVAGMGVSGDDETGKYEFSATVTDGNSNFLTLTGQVELDPETLLVTRFWEGPISSEMGTIEAYPNEPEPLLVTGQGQSTTHIMDSSDANFYELRFEMKESHPYFRLAAWVPTGEVRDMVWTLTNESGESIAGGTLKETMDYSGKLGDLDMKTGIYTLRVQSADNKLLHAYLKVAVSRNPIEETDDRAEQERKEAVSSESGTNQP